MTTNNPYAQAGWPNTNPSTVQQGSSSSHAPPSIFGALPFALPPTHPHFVTFTFTSFNPTILNCIVTGPDGQPYWRIVTDKRNPGFTIISTVQGVAIVVVEWQANPIVEIRDIIPKQYTSRWLSLSPERKARLMEVRGKRYIWTPGEDTIYLYKPDTNPPEMLAKVKTLNGSVSLDISTAAIHAGLLEACIAAAFLLLSGRSID